MNKVPNTGLALLLSFFMACSAHAQSGQPDQLASNNLSPSVCRNSGSGAAGAPSANYQTIDEANRAGWHLEENDSGACFKEALCQSNSILQPDYKTCACPLDMPYWDGNACATTPPVPSQRQATPAKIRNCNTAFEFGPLIARCDAADPERIYVLSSVPITLADGSAARYAEGAAWQTVRRGDTATLAFPPDHALRNAFANMAKVDNCNWHADGFSGSYTRRIELDGNVNFCQ